MEWIEARDITQDVQKIVRKLNFFHINCGRIICYRSYGSTSRAHARIWSFPRIWQQALKLPAYYIIEVLSDHFDHLSDEQRQRVLIHELLHIPKNFSGSLIPHRSRSGRIDSRRVDKLFQQLKDGK